MATDVTVQAVPQETRSIQATNPNELVYIERQSIVRPALFIQDNVKQLRESDFYLDSREYVCLKYDDCILLLAYGDNVESLNLCKVWGNAASNAAGSVYCAVHLGLERRVAENFAKLRDDPSHPLYWCRLQQYPFILIYRRGFPVGFYNGDRSTSSIVDFSLTLACEVSYSEKNNRFLSAEVDNGVEMTGLRVHDSQKRTSSVEFTTAEPLRGYDSNYPVKPIDRSEIDSAAMQQPDLGASAPVVASSTDIPQSILRTDSVPYTQPPAYPG